MISDQLNALLTSTIFYLQQHPRTVLWIWIILVLLVAARYFVKYILPDQIYRQFRKAGIRPSAEQERSLRDDFAKIVAENARKELQEYLRHQAAVQRDKEQLARVAELSRAHVAVIREVGTTLQALELEYNKYHKSLASEQAKEALRVVVEKAVAQITEMTAAPTTTLPEFMLEQVKLNGKHASTHNGVVVRS
ncbi:hypothetical protein BH10CHL1_BH10CHL1_43460 [soil metagenome]